MGAILGLSAAVLWGFGDLLARFAGQAIGAWRTLFYSELVGLLLLTLWLVGAGPGAPSIATIPASTLVLGLGAGLVHLVGAYALTQGLTVGTISLVMPVASTYGAVSAVLSIASGEPVSATAMAGIMLTVVGVALAGAGSVDGGSAGKPKGIGWAVLAAAAYGIAFWAQGVLLVPIVGSLPSVWFFLVIGTGTMALVALVGLQHLRPPPVAALAPTLGTGGLAVAAYVAVALGFATGEVAIVAVLSTLSSVVTAVLGLVVLGERLSLRQIWAIGLIIVGVVVINIG
jgi:drug/metabolite transporter (DMT)-like permease